MPVEYHLRFSPSENSKMISIKKHSVIMVQNVCPLLFSPPAPGRSRSPKKRNDSHERRKRNSDKTARDNYLSGDDGDGGTRRRSCGEDRRGGIAKKPRGTREEHSQSFTERKSKSRMKKHKEGKRKKERHGREGRKGKSSKGSKRTLEKRRKGNRNGGGSSSSSSSLSSESEEDPETPARERKERKSVSRGQELKNNVGGGSSAVATVASAVSPRDTDSRGEDEAVVLDEDAPTPPASPGGRIEEAELSVASVTDRTSFFAKLRALEGEKGMLGTVHTTGVQSGGGGEGGGSETIKSNDWECLKCGKSNFKNATSCYRCVDLRLSKREEGVLLLFLVTPQLFIAKQMFPINFSPVYWL